TKLQSEGSEKVGGHIEFMRLPNGAWVIARWSIMMPVLERVTSGTHLARGIETSELKLAEIRVEGGELSVVRRGRDTLWARRPIVLRGTVRDSLSNTPAYAARVMIVGTTFAAATDSLGAFVIEGLLPGDFF